MLILILLILFFGLPAVLAFGGWILSLLIWPIVIIGGIWLLIAMFDSF